MTAFKISFFVLSFHQCNHDVPNVVFFVLVFLSFIQLLFLKNYTLNFRVHVQIMQVCFAAVFSFTHIWHFSLGYSSPLPPTHCPSPFFPSRPQCVVLFPVFMCSLFSSPAYERECAVFHFLFLCQFAENDDF